MNGTNLCQMPFLEGSFHGQSTTRILPIGFLAFAFPEFPKDVSRTRVVDLANSGNADRSA